MSIELKIPEVGESIREVQIGRWLRQEGDFVKADEDLVELETDKATMELPAPQAGVLTKIVKPAGEIVEVGDVVAYLDETATAATAKSKQQPASKPEPSPPPAPQPAAPAKTASQKVDRESRKPAAPVEASPVVAAQRTAPPPSPPPVAPAAKPASKPAKSAAKSDSKLHVTPSARRAMREHGLTTNDIEVDGPRIRREDVLQSVAKRSEDRAPAEPAARQDLVPQEDALLPSDAQPAIVPANTQGDHFPQDYAREHLVPMSLIRRRIAERLVDAQHQAALLTTFNEIDLTAVKQLRKTHGDRFQAKHGIKLGFMSFFVKATVDALKQMPELNAEIRGNQIAYRNYYHIGVAIGSEKGLVVPVLRHAERLSFAEIEHAIADFATRANNNKIAPNDLTDGTFTISNGGVYGSLLSTPIVNPPQSGVLGMHSIQDRPVAIDGNVVIRPMMYVALTYDHRIVDGREGVTFLRRIKEAIEEPARMLIEA